MGGSDLSDRFYTTGGTLSHDAPSYVERAADRALIEGLHQGEFCYILTSRQMGKSSLMIRTAATLRMDEESEVAVLDLAAVGQNLTPEQWYDGMLLRLGRQLGVEDELDDFWLENDRLGPVQRFFEALYQVVLLKRNRRLILFIDELDTVRSLPFSSDEFLAAIRHCYNVRAVNPVWKRLCVCLLGVATPSDLIQDPHISPFNIGRRIVLEDFKRDEVAKLVSGLEAEARGEMLLDRIFGWTNGHPYLTQRLCRSVAELNRSDTEASVLQPGTIDGICHRLFLSNRAKERDDNLIFVRERLLRSNLDRVALLDLYRKVRGGQAVVDDETNPLIGALHLSGVSRIEKGNLRVRNRIYQHVFNLGWVKAMMPDAELRRQKEAYRRGVIRTTALSVVVVMVMLFLAVMAFERSRQARSRLIALNTNNGSRLLAAGEYFDALAWFTENLKLADEGSVAEQLGRKRFGTIFRRSPTLTRMLSHEGDVRHVAFSPDRSLLLTASDDRHARIWDLATGELRYPPITHGGEVVFGDFSPDGTRFLTASSDRKARVFDTATGRMITDRIQHDYEVHQAVFSPDGRHVGTASSDETARVWDAETGAPVSQPLQHVFAVRQVAFTGKGDALLSASEDGMVKVWDWNKEGESPRFELRHGSGVNEMSLHKNGRLLATGTRDGEVHFWRLDTGLKTFSVSYPAAVTSVRFTADGRSLAVGGEDGVVRLLDVASRQGLVTPLVHSDPIKRVEFSPAGDLILTVTKGNEVRVWDAANGRLFSPPFRHLNYVNHAAFDPSGRRIATAGADRLVKVWDLAGIGDHGREWRHSQRVRVAAFAPNGESMAYGTEDGKVFVIETAQGERRHDGGLDHGADVSFVVFGPDSERLVSGGVDGTARVWDLETGRQVFACEHGDRINFARFNHVGSRLVTASRDRTAKLWDTSTGSLVATPFEHRYAVVNASFAAGGREVVTAATDNSVHVWNTLTGERVRGPFRTGYSLGRPAFDDPGERFMALTSSKTARVFSLGTGKPLSDVMSHRGEIHHLSFDTRGGRVVTASQDQTARIWAAWDGRPISPPLKHRGAVVHAEFGADSHQVLTIGEDQTVRLWSAHDGVPIAPAMGYREPVTGAVLDGLRNRLVSLNGTSVFEWAFVPDGLSKEDLVHTAELLSGRHRAATGELTGLSTTNLLQSWMRLSTNHMAYFTVTDEQATKWHERGARRALEYSDAFGADFHAKEMLRLNAGSEGAETFMLSESQGLAQGLAQGLVLGRGSRRGFERSYRNQLDARIPTRDPGLSPKVLDLTSFYNGHIEDAWQGTQTAGNTLQALGIGIRELGGVTFDIRGILQLNGLELASNSHREFPNSIFDVPVGLAGTKLHLLLASAYGSSFGEPVGTVRFHFADRSIWERPLIYGVDLADWWQLNSRAGVENLLPVWQGTTPSKDPIRLFLTTIEIPWPDIAIARIDLQAGGATAAPFIVGLTLE